MMISAFQINADEYLSDASIQLMTLAEEGSNFRRILDAARRGDADFLSGIGFIGGLTISSGIKSHRKYIHQAIRMKVLSIGLCALCGSNQRLEVDHMVPVAKGGTDDESNLQALCRTCNRKKAAKI